jgi:hypothetical protein
MTVTHHPEGATMSNAARKIYSSARKEKLDEAFDFQLDDVIFVAYPHRAGGTRSIDLAGMQVTKDPAAMWDFLRVVLTGPREPDGSYGEGDFERFKEYVESPEHPILAETLGEIINDMLEEDSGRPTVPSGS